MATNTNDDLKAATEALEAIVVACNHPWAMASWEDESNRLISVKNGDVDKARLVLATLPDHHHSWRSEVEYDICNTCLVKMQIKRVQLST